jgi:hypothetical protein
MSDLDLNAVFATATRAAHLPPLDPNGAAMRGRQRENEYREALIAWRVLTSQSERHAPTCTSCCVLATSVCPGWGGS